MKAHWLFVSASLLASPAFSADKATVMEMAKKDGCLACHSMDKKMVGPAWNDIGKKYAGDPDAEARLITKVKKGGKGVWGQIPMPGNVTIKNDDIKTLVQFILTLK